LRVSEAVGSAVVEGEGIPSRYRVVGMLGRGAFAVAYRCEDVESGEDVVVKLYELRERAWSVLTSFEREAAVLAELSHPAIPRYHAHAQLADGRLMLVQSHAPGRSLATLLRDGKRFTDDEVADLAEQVLVVLEYLQSLNPPIVHRDVKPANLVLDDANRLRLVDFGSVKEGFRRDAELASTIVGTYGYMAPEQFQGRASIQSDLYGLGATVVHLLSHVPPSELPQDGLKLDFHASVKASPGMLVWLDRMLEPDPRQRFANAKQALTAFRARELTSTSRAVVASAARSLIAAEPPYGSRIRVTEQDGELQLVIPGSGFRASSLPMLGFSGFWLAFVTFWTIGASKGSLFFALFSIPFWLVGFWMLLQTVRSMFEVVSIRLGPERYAVRRMLWGFERRYDGRTAVLEGAALSRAAVSSNQQQIKFCVLHAGTEAIKFGMSLGAVERRWVVTRINEHLGLHLDDELEDES
jgi:eukaryotic-like serine/threonine-protein kinase